MSISKGSKFISNRDVSLPMVSTTGMVHIKTGDKAMIVLSDKSSVTIMIDGVSYQVQSQPLKEAVISKTLLSI